MVIRERGNSVNLQTGKSKEQACLMKGTAHWNPPSLSIQGKVCRLQRRPQAESPERTQSGQTIDGSDRVPIRRREIFFDIFTNMELSPENFSF